MTSWTSSYVCELLKEAKNKLGIALEVLNNSSTDFDIRTVESIKSGALEAFDWVTATYQDAKMHNSNMVRREKQLGIKEELITKFES